MRRTGAKEKAELRLGAGCGVKMWEKNWGVLHVAGMAAETEIRERDAVKEDRSGTV